MKKPFPRQRKWLREHFNGEKVFVSVYVAIIVVMFVIADREIHMDREFGRRLFFVVAAMLAYAWFIEDDDTW